MGDSIRLKRFQSAGTTHSADDAELGLVGSASSSNFQNRNSGGHRKHSPIPQSEAEMPFLSNNDYTTNNNNTNKRHSISGSSSLLDNNSQSRWPQFLLWIPFIFGLRKRNRMRYLIVVTVIIVMTMMALMSSVDYGIVRQDGQEANDLSDFEKQQQQQQDNSRGHDHRGVPISATNDVWRGKTSIEMRSIPQATWTCTNQGDDSKEAERSRQCVVENLCVDRQGAFIRNNNLFFDRNFPKINLMSADDEADSYWQPRVERFWSTSKAVHYVDDTLFVHGLYSPFHFSHWLYNGMMPLYSTMKRFGATKNSWTMRAARFFYDDIQRQGKWEMEHFFPNGQELVFTQAEISTSFQTLPPSDAPICFKRAVIGLGSQCALNYCAKNIPTEIYQLFRDEIQDYYWPTPEAWKRHVDGVQKKLDDEEIVRAVAADQQQTKDKESNTEKDKNTLPKSKNSPLKCLDTTRYYNFEQQPSIPDGQASDQLEIKPDYGGEKRNRIGYASPDDQQDLSTNYRADLTGKRLLVIGIIQRESSRTILNDQELIQGLVQQGYRVKWMSFDHGCGLAETAYLLRDVNILISPHGNALGTSIFMPNRRELDYNGNGSLSAPTPMVISVDSSKYWENWFMYTSTAQGQRFNFNICGPTDYVDEESRTNCPFYKDEARALVFLKKMDLILGVEKTFVSEQDWNLMNEQEKESVRIQQRLESNITIASKVLFQKELDLLIGPDYSHELSMKYGESRTWKFLGEFWKDMPRYANIPAMIRLVNQVQMDADKEKELLVDIEVEEKNLYLEYCRQGRGCGPRCKSIMERNVVGNVSVFGQYSVDNLELWGQYKDGNPKQDRFLEDMKDWPVPN